MSGGNVKLLTALGEALVEMFSDVGSTPTASTIHKWNLDNRGDQMNKEDQIFDLLERLYIELQDTKKELKEDITSVRTELKEDITNVRTELKEEISSVRTELKEEVSNVRAELKEDIASSRTELKEDIKILNDNQMIIFDKLEKIGTDIESIKEDILSVEMLTARNYKDIVRLKSVR